MRVELLHHTPLDVALVAGLTCTGNEDKQASYTPEKFLKKLSEDGHESVLEHISYSFQIEGISRALLQELARHRHASLSVQSTRWALQKVIKGEEAIEPVLPVEHMTPMQITYAKAAFYTALSDIKVFIGQGASNDVIKYYLPESFPTKLVWTVNARSLRNVFKLRTSKRALVEFQELCYHLYQQLPYQHLSLYTDVYFNEGVDSEA